MLQSDLAKIESLVEEAVRQLSSAASASSVRPLDACEVMEAMNRHHLNELLPRIQEADTAFEQLCSHCIDCKVGKSGLRLSTFQVFCWEGWIGKAGLEGGRNITTCGAAHARFQSHVSLHCSTGRISMHCMMMHCTALRSAGLLCTALR